jgi:hypothetical protein
VTSIQIPDPVMVWEAGEKFDHTDSLAMVFTIQVRVGGVVVFERKYRDDYGFPGEYAYDLNDAKEKASAELAERLQTLLNGDVQ